MANHWSKDKRPSRQRYWERHVLEHKKVNNILANKQRYRDKEGLVGKRMNRIQALEWWQSHRKGRVPDNYIPLSLQFGNK